MSVTIRTKELKNGNTSLYLDIYENGKRRYEYLHLYLIPEANATCQRLNKETMKKALELKSKLVLGQLPVPKEKKTCRDVPLLEWVDTYARNLEERGNVSAASIQQTRLVKDVLTDYLSSIKKRQVAIHAFDKNLSAGFLSFLQSYKGIRAHRLSANTLKVYQQRIIAILNAAVREGLIKENPFDQLSDAEKYFMPHLSKDFLTIDEIQKIAATKHSNDEVRLAFLFACFTGLRISDIRSLEWSDMKNIDGMYFVIKEQKKTHVMVSVPLCHTAMTFLPEHKGDGMVFHLPQNTWLRGALQRIIKAAGIEKNISFHSSRHTFASLTIRSSRDLKTVSSLLGHKSAKTTQRYTDEMIDTRGTAVKMVDGVF